jgi:hypothetical protein
LLTGKGIDGFGKRIYSYPAILTEIRSADLCTNAERIENFGQHLVCC